VVIPLINCPATAGTSNQTADRTDYLAKRVTMSKLGRSKGHATLPGRPLTSAENVRARFSRDR